MPKEGIPGYLKLRILEPNFGAEIIPDLFHLHQVKWTVRGIQPGTPGSTTLGDFTIMLPAPKSAEGKRYAAQYALLDRGQKVEAYLGDTLTGTPKFTGVITQVMRPLNGPWTVVGFDTLWWLQQSQLLQGESIGTVNSFNVLGSQFVQALMGTQQILWDDDFSTYGAGHPNSSDYTATGTWSTSADPVFGLPSISASAASQGDLIASHTAFNTTSHFAINQVQGPASCVIRAQGVIDVHNNNNTTDAGEAGVYACASGNQRMLARLRMAYNGTTTPGGQSLYNVGVDLLTETAGGVYTTQATAVPFTNVLDRWVFDLQLVIDNCQGVRVILNGKDSGILWNPNVNLFTATGNIGLRCASLIAIDYVVYYNRLTFMARSSQTYAAGGLFSQTGWGTDRFQRGTFSVSARAFPQVIQGAGQTYLDLMVLAASFDGFTLVKVPARGYKGDLINYSLNPGFNYASKIILAEGDNIDENGTAVSPVADLFATAAKVNASSAGDSGGTMTWAPVASFYGLADSPMVLTDTVVDVGVPGAALLMTWAMLVAKRKIAPMTAIQVMAIRTPDVADKFDLWDTITVDVPSCGVNSQAAQVVGYTFQEGDTRMPVFLNQFPAAQLVQTQVQRLARPIEWLSHPAP